MTVGENDNVARFCKRKGNPSRGSEPLLRGSTIGAFKTLTGSCRKPSRFGEDDGMLQRNIPNLLSMLTGPWLLQEATIFP